MPRRPQPNLGDSSSASTASSSGVFHSPESQTNHTNYGLDFTTSRIENPFQPTNSQAAKSKSQPTARKRTSIGPRRSSRGTSEMVRPAMERSVEVARRRKQRRPLQRKQRLIREINKLRQSTNLQIPRLPFGRLVRELVQKHQSSVMRITRVALEALHESTEMYITQQLEDAYTLTLHRQRVTLSVIDLELLRFLRGRILI